jgi:hypothetical protein
MQFPVDRKWLRNLHHLPRADGRRGGGSARQTDRGLRQEATSPPPRHSPRRMHMNPPGLFLALNLLAAARVGML